MVRSLRDEGRCVVFSSHIMQEIEAVADHIVILNDGRKLAEGSIEELRQGGASDAAPVELTQVAGLFAYYNRIASGLGVDPEPDWWLKLEREATASTRSEAATTRGRRILRGAFAGFARFVPCARRWASQASTVS